MFREEDPENKPKYLLCIINHTLLHKHLAKRTKCSYLARDGGCFIEHTSRLRA